MSQIKGITLSTFQSAFQGIIGIYESAVEMFTGELRLENDTDAFLLEDDSGVIILEGDT